jgi:hypothetical protein
MNTPNAAVSAALLTLDLQAFRKLCAEALALMTAESQALADRGDYQPGAFNERRKRLLPQLESALIKLRNHRRDGRSAPHTKEIGNLFETIQSLLMKVLYLDRENQQALLRRGLVPPRHLPPLEAQQPHYVAGLYQQHSRIRGGVSL